MKTFGWAVLLGVLLTRGLAADSYRINFTGTVNSGTVKDFNLNDNALETVANLSGLQVSGWMNFNLAGAPAIVVSVDNSGFTNTVIQSTGGPIFVSEHFVIGGFTPPSADFLPMPTTFDLTPIPSLPADATITNTQDSQNLRFSTKPIVGPQSVISGMNLINSWTSPQLSGAANVSLDLLIASALAGPHFFPVPPTGDLPSNWGPVAIGTNGVVTLSQLFQNPTVGDHFGINTDYSVSAGFTINSASGGFVAAPEPSTFPLATFAVALIAVGCVFRTRPRPQER